MVALEAKHFILVSSIEEMEAGIRVIPETIEVVVRFKKTNLCGFRVFQDDACQERCRAEIKYDDYTS